MFGVLREIKRVFKDTTIYGLGSLLPKAAGIILVPIYTRYLLPSDYGIMSLASLITSMVAAALILGQNGSLTLYMRTSQKEHSAEDIRRLLFSVTAFVLLFGTLATALLFAFGPQLTARLFKSDQLTFYPYVAIALVTALLGLPFALQQAVNRARGQAKVHTFFQLSSFIINTTFTIVFVVALRQGAFGSLKGTFAAAAILAPITLFLLAREMTPALLVDVAEAVAPLRPAARAALLRRMDPHVRRPDDPGEVRDPERGGPVLARIQHRDGHEPHLALDQPGVGSYLLRPRLHR